MRVRDGRVECAQCGAILDIRVGVVPKVTLMAASGESTVRVLAVEGVEIHRCEIKSGR